MKVRYYLRKYKKDANNAYIEASFSWNGLRYQGSTGESIDAKNRNKKRRKRSDPYILKSQPWAHHINKRLEDIENWAGDLYYEYQRQHKELSLQEFKSEYKKFLRCKPEKTIISSDLTIIEILQKALDQKGKTTRKRTFETYKTTYNHFEEFVKESGYRNRFDIDDHICRSFENYLIDKFDSNTSVNNNTQFFHILLNQAVRMQLIHENPYKRSILSEEEGTHVAYDDDQAKAVMNYLQQHDPNLKRFCQFIYYSFARPAEIRSLTVGSINMMQNTLFIGATGKNRTNRPVEILPPFQALIEEMKIKDHPPNHYIFTRSGSPGLKPVSKNFFTVRFRNIMRDELKFPDHYTMYSFKHYGVIKHFLAGFDLRWLQDQTGHQDISNLMKYLRSLGLKINRANNIKAPEL